MQRAVAPVGAQEPRGHECSEDEKNGDGEGVVDAVGRVDEQVGAGISQRPLSGSGQHRHDDADDHQERNEAPGKQLRPWPPPQAECLADAVPVDGAPRPVAALAGSGVPLVPDVEDDARRLGFAGGRGRVRRVAHWQLPAAHWPTVAHWSAPPGSGRSSSVPVKISASSRRRGAMRRSGASASTSASLTRSHRSVSDP